MNQSDEQNPDFVPVVALATTAAALLPLAVFAIDVWIERWQLVADPVQLFRHYCALLLGFAGGVRWGAAMIQQDSRADRTMWLTLIPLILALVSLLLRPHDGLVVLMLGLAALGAWDSISYSQSEDHGWYVTLRIFATFLAVSVTIFVWWIAPVEAPVVGQI